ncbi:hypothetical protein P6166_12120 [Stenotrophomonas sp. HITSZ_GD]|uniref:hypothetical protein n=1 Tax=Stenotrophomonas sp. HITSZ_GD TaxID=3037248 RepID=UPI00240CFD2F|nr:hypothetical protein [Stenotrophomonas sp. HITSZ_GD]MDG2526102.1 hypothetical protein [Stenotrophomonas sp. HITSZ_GD]
MRFEIIFITEGPETSPAAEIQFLGQRLCVLRLVGGNATEVTFLQDVYLNKPVDMTFPLAEFQDVVSMAIGDLTDWDQRLRAANSA